MDNFFEEIFGQIAAFFEGIFAQIIDFFEGLFGGGGDDTQS